MSLSTLRKLFFNKGTRTFLYCLFAALLLWAVVCLNDTFRHTFSYPIRFTNKANKGIIVLQSESAIQVDVADNGFKMIYFSLAKRKKEITIDLDEFLHDKTQGKYIFQANKHKHLLLSKLKYANDDARIMTDSIVLTWAPIYKKKVKPVLDINLSFATQYGLYGEAVVYPKDVTITGTVASLKKIHSVSSQKVDLQNLTTSSFHYIPLKKYAEYPDVSIPIPYVAVFLPVEIYTETEVEIPITIPENLQNTIKIFPDKTQVICMVALKDYKKIKPDMFAASIQYDSTKHQTALPVHLSHFPDFIKNQRLKLNKVDYVIIKK